MKTIKILVVVCALCLFSVVALAEENNLKQKLIFLNGAKSSLMLGDQYFRTHKKPINYNPNGVLPSFLENGWRIKSVNVKDKGKDDSVHGYVVIEKTK